MSKNASLINDKDFHCDDKFYPYLNVSPLNIFLHFKDKHLTNLEQ